MGHSPQCFMLALSKRSPHFLILGSLNPIVTAKQHDFEKQNFKSEVILLSRLVKSHQHSI